MHGVRGLALEHGLAETSTVERIEKLVHANVLRADFGRDLKEAFHFLTTMRLDNQLAERAGREAVVRTATLGSTQRDLLREAFKVVKQFRDFLRRHYNFAMF